MPKTKKNHPIIQSIILDIEQMLRTIRWKVIDSFGTSGFYLERSVGAKNNKINKKKTFNQNTQVLLLLAIWLN